MTGAEAIGLSIAIPAATIGWLHGISWFEARQQKLRDCHHDTYEEYIDHLKSWKVYCRKCHYQDDITAEKRAEEQRGRNLGDR